MSKTQITARVDGQTLKLVNVPLIASGSDGVLHILCEFDDAWDGYGTTAVFFRNKDEVYHVPMVADEAEVPKAVMADEGVFYFGVLGQADNIRTTEVVPLEVKQGAITVPTGEDVKEVPSVYQEIMAAYGQMDARIDALVALKGTSNVETWKIEPEHFTGMLYCNGMSAYAQVTLDGVPISAYGEFLSEYCIHPKFAPMNSRVTGLRYNHDGSEVDVILEFPRDEESQGWGRFRVIDRKGVDGTWSGAITDFTYPLAAPYIAELNDLRLDIDGETHGSAGAAVRAQMASTVRTVVQDLSVKQQDTARINIGMIPGTDSNGPTTVEVHDGEEDGFTICYAPNETVYHSDLGRESDAAVAEFYGVNGDERTVLRNIAEGVGATDAVNKAQLDAAIAELKSLIQAVKNTN